MLGGEHGKAYELRFLQCEGARRAEGRECSAGGMGAVADLASSHTKGSERWLQICFRAYGWRFATLALMLIVVFVLSPEVAYASESWATVDGPFVTGLTENDKGYVVINVGNPYDAALAVIGRKSDKIQLSNEQLARLSNDGSGGAFYDLASKFFAVGSTGTTYHSFPGWWGDSLFQSNMVSLNGGFGHTWAVETSQREIASAREDYLVIYGGGSLGGGGVSTDGNIIKARCNYTNAQGAGLTFDDIGGQQNFWRLNLVSWKNDWDRVYSDRDKLPELINVSVPDTALGYLSEVDSTLYDVVWRIYPDNGLQVYVYLLPKGQWEYTTYTVTVAQTHVFNCHYAVSFSAQTIQYVHKEWYFVYDSATNTLVYRSGDSIKQSDFKSTSSISSRMGSITSLGLIGPPAPPLTNNWPDDGGSGSESGIVPEPDPPAPVEPEVPVSEPYVPELPTPWMPIVVYDPVGTDPSDYTPWLRAILQELRNFHVDFALFANALESDLNTHCLHVTRALADWSRWLRSGLYKDASILLNDLESYLRSLFVWLSGVISDGTFDPSALLRWLNRIDEDIRGLDLNVNVTSPGYSPGDYTAVLAAISSGVQTANGYLRDLLRDFDDLLGREWPSGSDVVVDVPEVPRPGPVAGGDDSDVGVQIGDKLGELGRHFPFSLPWDVAYLLGLLQAEPVAPVFTLPVLTTDAEMTIDLSIWESVAVVTRSATLFMFAFGLVLRTRSLLGSGGGLDA